MNKISTALVTGALLIISQNGVANSKAHKSHFFDDIQQFVKHGKPIHVSKYGGKMKAAKQLSDELESIMDQIERTVETAL